MPISSRATAHSPSRVKERLARDEPVSVLILALAEESLVEMASTMGFDAVWIDAQHHDLGAGKVANLVRAAGAGGSDVFVRAPRHEFARMSRFLDSGARGVMCPRCTDGADAATLVSWLKFPPLGQRAYGPVGPDAGYLEVTGAEYMRACNENTFTVMDLEYADGVRNSGDIAATPGVDVLYVTPDDERAGRSPSDRDPVAQVAAAARRAGKHWGAPASGVEMLEQRMEEGARFVPLWCDLDRLRAGLHGLRKDLARVGFSF